MDRKAFLTSAATIAAATTAGVTLTGAATAPSDTAPTDSAPAAVADVTQITYLNLRSLHTAYDWQVPTQGWKAHGIMHMVATLQGIVNRATPRLYVDFVTHGKTQQNTDEYWWEYLTSPGVWLSDTGVVHTTDLDVVMSTYVSLISGAVVYDPKVHATANVASTVAGADNLVAIPYDTQAGSMYDRYVVKGSGGVKLPVKVWLVNQNGTSLFTGSGTIPGTTIASTKSAKNDAYIWALEKYLKTGKSEPRRLAFEIDTWWFNQPYGIRGAAIDGMPFKHDYMVAMKGFFFDLNVWKDERPIDDPGQPVGTDYATLLKIFGAAQARLNGALIKLQGYIPWEYKYTKQSQAPGEAKNDPVPTEWQQIRIASAYDAYTEADGLYRMCNASFYNHFPKRSYTQNPKPTLASLKAKGYVDVAGKVVPKRYVAIYCGDYDSPAWLYENFHHQWNDPGRGSLPLSWGFNPNLVDRMPLAFHAAFSTLTSNDVIVAGDSGAGYVNPGNFTPARYPSNLPSGLPKWTLHNTGFYSRFDMNTTGFLIDGSSKKISDAELTASYAKFSPGGVACQFRTAQVVGGLPIINVTDGDFKVMMEKTGDLTKPPPTPMFRCLRDVLVTPTDKGEYLTYAAERPAAKIVFVTQPELLQLIKIHFG